MMQAAPTRWRSTLAIGLVLLAGVLLVYRETALAMVDTWSRSDTYAHAFLVPPIVLWLIWRRRHALAQMTPRAQPWVVLPMAAVGLLWLLGSLASVNAAMQLALVALIVLLVPAVAGVAVARELLFPLGFLFFAVPIGEFLTPTMISWTADATILALRWSGIPVYREGMDFVIPSGSWSVVEACSGVRYLIASLMVGTLFAYLNYRSTKRRLLFVGVSIVVPIVANWMRAYMIVMLGHLSDNRIATGVDHLVYGWVFFGVVILLMFVIGARWSEPDDPPPAPGAAAIGYDTPAAWGQASGWALVAGVALVVVWPQLALSAVARGETSVPAVLSLPDALADGWRAADAPVAPWTPGFANPSVAARRSYAHGDRTVGVFIGYYRQQDAQSKLVSSSNTLAASSKDARWNRVGGGLRSVDQDPQSISVRASRLRGQVAAAGPAATQRLLVWQTYWVNGRFTPSDSRAKIHGALSRLSGRGDDGAVLLFYTPYEEGAADAAEAALEAFVRANLQPLQALLQATRDAR